MISGKQLKAARALLGWRQSDLAEHAGLWGMTVLEIEHRGLESSGAANVEKIVQGLEAEGIAFTTAGGVDLAWGVMGNMEIGPAQ